MPRRLQDILDQADELADRFEKYEPKSAHDRSTPEMKLRRAAYERALAERHTVEAVTAARAENLSWDLIGKLLGTSGSAAHRRYHDVVAEAPET